MFKDDYLNLIQSVDADLASHRILDASKKLITLSIDTIPDSYKAQLSALARRCNLLDLSLKLLWSHIYENPKPDPQHILEYASTLRKLGLVHQAGLLLQRLPETPETLMAQSFNAIHQWKYEDAFKLLVQCSNFEKQPLRFQYLVRINSIACLIQNGEPQYALKVLKPLQVELKSQHFHLYLNSLELEGYCHLSLKNPKEALDCFTLGLSQAKNQPGLTTLFLEKGSALARLALDPTPKSLDNIEQLRNRIRKNRHWESLRELDLLQGQITNDKSLLFRAYFGSPFKDFKNKVLYSLDSALPHRHIWAAAQNSNAVKSEKVLDVLSSSLQLPFGKSQQRLLMLLCSDIYRPFSTMRIFDQFYKNEVYDPFTSDQRIHQLLYSLREELSTLLNNDIISSTVAGYRVRPDKHLSIYLYSQMVFQDTEEIVLYILKQQSDFKYFKREDVDHLLPLSKDQWQRSLKKLEDNNFLTAQGSGRSKLYSIKGS